MDKLAFGAVMHSAGIPTLPRVLVGASEHVGFPGPYIVKPRFGGSSLGIEVVPDSSTALDLVKIGVHYREGAVLEPYREDLFDLNIAYRTWPVFSLSSIERPVRSGSPIYGYEDKYLAGAGLESSPRELPARLAEPLERELRSLARRVFEATNITGLVRVDFLSDGTSVYVNEVNAIPGAMALYLWGADQDLAELLVAQLEEAEKRLSSEVVAFSSTGSALRSAGGISAKLAGYRNQNRGES
jgi:D-alanine-D-alanine ligase